MVKGQFKERFRKLYDLSGCSSIAEFSRKLDMNRQSVDRYYNGERCPDSTALTQICERMKVSADWLLGLSDVKSSSSDIKDVCKITGLSEKAVAKIIPFKPFRDISEFVENIDFVVENGSAKYTQEGIEKRKRKKLQYSSFIKPLSMLIESERFNNFIFAYKDFIESAEKLDRSTLERPQRQQNDIETVILSREDATRYYMRRVSDEIMFICEEEFKKHMMVAAENERQRNERMMEEEDPDDQQEDE